MDENNKVHHDLRPVGEHEGHKHLQRALKLVEAVGVVLTITGLFVSIGGGLETVVGLAGVGLTILSRSNAFARWLGEKTLPKR